MALSNNTDDATHVKDDPISLLTKRLVCIRQVAELLQAQIDHAIQSKVDCCGLGYVTEGGIYVTEGGAKIRIASSEL